MQHEQKAICTQEQDQAVGLACRNLEVGLVSLESDSSMLDSATWTPGNLLSLDVGRVRLGRQSGLIYLNLEWAVWMLG